MTWRLFSRSKATLLAVGLIVGFAIGYFVFKSEVARLMDDVYSARSSVHFIGSHSITDNKRFMIVDTLRPGGLVLRESVRVDREAGVEGADATVVVDAFDKERMKPLWKVREPGEFGAVQGPLYKVTKIGCCDAPDTYTYFSLQDGKKLYSSHDDDLMEVIVPSKYYPSYGTVDVTRRYVSYKQEFSYDSQGHEKAVTGILQYGTEKKVIREVDIYAGAKTSVSLPEGLTILYNGKRYSYSRGRAIEPWNEPGGLNRSSKSLSDFVIVLAFTNGAELRLPVENDDINLRNTTVPRELTIRPR